MVVTCPNPGCDGVIESSSKVYAEITEGHFNEDGEVVIIDMTFSRLNDRFKGHPYNFEGELCVSCSECGEEFVSKFDDNLRKNLDGQTSRLLRDQNG